MQSGWPRNVLLSWPAVCMVGASVTTEKVGQTRPVKSLPYAARLHACGQRGGSRMVGGHSLPSRLAMGRRPGRLWKGHSSCRVLSSSCSSDGRWMRSGCHRRDMVLQKGDIGSDILGFSITAFEVFLDEYYKASGQTSASMGPADE